MPDDVIFIEVGTLPTVEELATTGLENAVGRRPNVGDKVIARAGEASAAAVVAGIDPEAQTITVVIPPPSNAI